MSSLPDHLIVTGTDTDVGKTCVSLYLLRQLPSHRYWKPVQTGSKQGTDSQTIAALLPNQPVLPERHCFPEPLSPHLAAQLAGQRIELPPLLTELSSHCQQGPLLVEGAGGLLVPLNGQDLMIDFFAQSKLPVVLASRATLGTINHTLLSIEALRKRSIPLLGVVLCGAPDEQNRSAIEHYGQTKVLGRISWAELTFCSRS